MAVARHPDVELAVPDPRDADLRAIVIHFSSLGELFDYMDGFFDLAERGRLPAENPLGRVAAPDAADRAVAEHFVEGGEGGGRDRGVAGSGVGNEGPYDLPLGL